jgi:ribulose-5-phosphate 4-epimerase/fuculose-1-phosphate aldolase
MTDDDARADLALARRVGTRLGLIDADGHVSVREGGRILVTPAAWAVPGRRVTPDDLVAVTLEGDTLAGDPAALPCGLAVDLAIYRARPNVRAIATGAPWTALAFGVTGRDVLPLTHTWAEYVLGGAAWLDVEAWAWPGSPADAGSAGRARDAADAAVAVLGVRDLVHVPGVALLTLGDEPLDVLRRLDAVEYLARMTIAATERAGRPRTVTVEEAASIPGQRPAEVAPSRDYRRYYRSLDRPPISALDEHWPASDELARVCRDVAAACRILAAAGDLVGFFEHVSHRIPGRDDVFAMSPAADFARMEPTDIGVLEMAGDCRRLAGPLPPAPFRWYHRDILEARPDVAAIVHTHELEGRAWMLAGATTPPVHRLAVRGVGPGMPPAYERPSLLFAPEDRRAMLDLLGDGPWVHNLAHGTDVCAPDIATATIAAIHWDLHLRFAALAGRIGSPRPLPEAALVALREVSAPPATLWAERWDALPG